MEFARICARLDPRCYKAFLAVVSQGSFSAAAPKAAMTVSGVSQHIANIEEAIGSVLFVRTASGCKLTAEGQRFHNFVKCYGNLLADLFEDLATSQNRIQGVVRYAMPPSCILSPHFPLLLERRLAHPDLELDVSLTPNSEILDLLLNGHIDFGFVTERVQNPVLAYRAFCQEEYILVGQDPELLQRIQADNIIHQRFVLYPGMNVYFNFFIRHTFPELTDVDARSIYHVSGRINTIEGGIKMTSGGLGISVFPRHCVQHLLESGQLHEFRQPDCGPLMNQIYIVHHGKIPMPRRVEAVIEWFMEMLHH